MGRCPPECLFQLGQNGLAHGFRQLLLLSLAHAGGADGRQDADVHPARVAAVAVVLKQGTGTGYGHRNHRGTGLDRNAELIVRRDLGILPPEELERRCRSLGAELLPSNADFCARFDFAPRYPIWLKVWFSDEEFPASGRLLLDESAPHYLTIEDAVTVGSLILDQLTGAQHWAV